MQIASIRIEKLENQEKRYIDQIHILHENNREKDTRIQDLVWKLKNGISREGYVNLLKVKNKKEPSKEEMSNFDNADINNDMFLTFHELELFSRF